MLMDMEQYRYYKTIELELDMVKEHVEAKPNFLDKAWPFLLGVLVGATAASVAH